MTWMTLRRAAATSALLFLAACGALDVSDPTAIEEEDLGNGTGADLMRRNAVRQLHVAVGAGALASGLLADEFLADPTLFFVQSGQASDEELLDRRESQAYEERLVTSATTGGVYGSWHDVRRAATVAIPRLRAFAPEPPKRAHIGEMFAVRGFATLHLAEDFCAGFPLNDIVDLKPVYGPPLTTDEAFAHALADFDSALAYATDSARIVTFARLGQARTLLGLGRFAEAASAAAGVPTAYVSNAEFSNTSSPFQPNYLAFGQSGDFTRSVADQEGGSGLDFVSAGDPRVQTTRVGTALDGETGIYRAAKYPNRGASIVLASGLEARLIEAEAALQAGGDWLGILNQLRATQVSPAMAALTDPGTAEARLDLLFRERAFWLFGTGHRLGDLRRLISRYGRTSESVFPAGPYRLGDAYDNATSIPFPAALEAAQNPAITGCTSR